MIKEPYILKKWIPPRRVQCDVRESDQTLGGVYIITHGGTEYRLACSGCDWKSSPFDGIVQTEHYEQLLSAEAARYYRFTCNCTGA